ncbi:hypothetical protein BH23GEM7_BH23GEM7_33030 [soil metagenome]
MTLSLSPILLLVTLGGCAAAATSAAADGAVPAPARGSSHVLAKEYAGEVGARRYLLFVPASYDGTAELPLVVMLHGCTQDAEDFARGTRMNALAEEYGFLVAYPEQPQSAHPQKCWNWYAPEHQQREAGEPALVAGITREVMREHRVDPARVFVAGISAGAAMSVIMAATYPDLYAAAASHSGIGYRAAEGVPQALAVMREGRSGAAERGALVLAAMGERRRPVPLLLFHGAADPVVSPLNASQLEEQWSAASAAEGTEPVVESRIVEGLGHAWSGGSPEGSYTDAAGPDASREIVRFFLAHPRRP